MGFEEEVGLSSFGWEGVSMSVSLPNDGLGDEARISLEGQPRLGRERGLYQDLILSCLPSLGTHVSTFNLHSTISYEQDYDPCIRHENNRKHR